MIIDKTLLFSEGQIVNKTAASKAVADVGTGDLGASPLELVAVTGADATGDGTLVVALESCDAADGTFVTLVESRGLKAADLKAGVSVLPVRVPMGARRFLRLNYVVTGTLSVSLTAFLTMDRARG